MALRVGAEQDRKQAVMQALTKTGFHFSHPFHRLTGGIRTRLGQVYSEIFVTFRHWRAKPAFFRKAANLPEIRVPEVEEFSRDGFFVRQGKNAGNI